MIISDEKVLESLTSDNKIFNNGALEVHSFVQNFADNSINSEVATSIIENMFKDGVENILIKTPIDTIEFSKQEYESEEITFQPAPNSNILYINYKEKTVVLFLNELTIMGVRE
jgi:hypothetical protein